MGPGKPKVVLLLAEMGYAELSISHPLVIRFISRHNVEFSPHFLFHLLLLSSLTSLFLNHPRQTDRQTDRQTGSCLQAYVALNGSTPAG